MLLVVVSVATIVGLRDQYARLEGAARTQSEQQMLLIGRLVSRSLAADDLKAVERVLMDAVAQSPTLKSVAILDQSGGLTAAFPEIPAGGADGLFEFRSALAHDGQNLGQIVTRWSIVPGGTKTGERIAGAAFFTPALLVAIGFAFLFLVVQLGLRPLSRIHNNLAATQRREAG